MNFSTVIEERFIRTKRIKRDLSENFRDNHNGRSIFDNFYTVYFELEDLGEGVMMKSNFKMTEGKRTNCWHGLTGGGRGSRIFC